MIWYGYSLDASLCNCNTRGTRDFWPDSGSQSRHVLRNMHETAFSDFYATSNQKGPVIPPSIVLCRQALVNNQVLLGSGKLNPIAKFDTLGSETQVVRHPPLASFASGGQRDWISEAGLTVTDNAPRWHCLR